MHFLKFGGLLCSECLPYYFASPDQLGRFSVGTANHYCKNEDTSLLFNFSYFQIAPWK
jgi:hypothetical protein